jgi:long-chain acyl-CoA synthetase
MGRMESFIALAKNCTLAYPDPRETLIHNLIELKPTVIVAVPSILETLCNGIKATMQTESVGRFLADWSLKTATAQARDQQEGQPLSVRRAVGSFLSREIFLKKLRNQLGGRLRFVFSGGAPLESRVEEFFFALGAQVLEGYGLTETTGCITINTPYAFAFGTVGKPFPEVSIRLSDQHEILVKSQKVMKEYDSNPEATRAAMTPDGYFQTGDLGEWTAEGYLKLIGRKKDLIALTNGRFVAPQKIENLFKEFPLISHVLVHGEGRPHVVALLTLRPDILFQLARERQISYQDYTALVQFDAVQGQIRKIVETINAQLDEAERIQNFVALPTPFSVEGGELTPSLKVRRQFCNVKYKNWFDRLY